MTPASANLLARILLLAWPAVCLLFFYMRPPRQALILSIFSGWLLLPVVRFELPGFPDYGRAHAVAIGALAGVLLFDSPRLLSFQPRIFDLPAVAWCASAGAASLANNLGAYDAVSATAQRSLTWGVFYLIGRIYFADLSGLRALAHAMFVGGLAYAPLCLLEMRFSPQLHVWLYGFHQHDFAQSLREGGWRPVVFMEHGLAVGLWMSFATLSGVWLWKSGRLRERYFGLPAGLCVVGLAAVTILGRSAGALSLLGVGLLFFALRGRTAAVLLPLLLLAPVAYIYTRASGIWTGQNLVELVTEYSPRRAESLAYRLRAEDVLVDHALKQPVFGWGGFGRNRPVTFDENALNLATDGLWVIAVGQSGLLGLVSILLVLLLPPAILWLRLPPSTWAAPRLAPVVVAALSLMLFAVDCLFNAMFNPVYLIFAGGLAAAACAPARAAARPVAAWGAAS
jgi:O-antigen ligase